MSLVLLVEDEPSLRLALGRYLERNDYGFYQYRREPTCRRVRTIRPTALAVRHR